MLCSDLFRIVSGKLNDEDMRERRWEWEEGLQHSLVDSMNCAIREIVAQRPDATAITEIVGIGEGMRHHIPVQGNHGASKNAVSLINVIRNMGTNGTTAGRPIFRVELDAMRTAKGWNATTTTRIQNWAYAPLDQRHIFWVYPAVAPQTTLYVELMYSAEPEQVQSSADNFPLPEAFANAAVHYMLADLLSGDTSESSNAKATMFYQMFQNCLGIKTQTDIAFPIRQQGTNYANA